MATKKRDSTHIRVPITTKKQLDELSQLLNRPVRDIAAAAVASYRVQVAEASAVESQPVPTGAQ